MRAKVLVVDDEFLIRMSLESGLSDLGYHVRTAESIREGTELAETFRPDVVLLGIGAVTHHVVGGHAVEFKDVGDKLLFILLDGSGLLALLHHCHDLIGQFLTLIPAQPGQDWAVEQ